MYKQGSGITEAQLSIIGDNFRALLKSLIGNFKSTACVDAEIRALCITDNFNMVSQCMEGFL